MGNVKGVSHDEWPKQSPDLGRIAGVTFRYDTARAVRGTIVRDDLTAPFETIIQLEDGRFVRGVECQFSPWDVPR